jgi:hypothetical protein
MRVRTALFASFLLLEACAVPRRPAVLPPEGEGYVAVLSGEMPGALSQVARHAWIVVSVPGEPRLRRFELGGGSSEPFYYFGHGEVAVHGVVHYERTELMRVLACLERQKRAYDEDHPDYFPIPGPNSNTIIDYLLRHCDIHVELPATAIGRDYRGPVGASVTSLGTGVQLETWVVGVKLGVEEGVELHLFDLPFGVHFWPPGITVPVNPGRIGFDDSTRRDLAPRRYHSGESERDYGLVSFWMWSHYARLRDPNRAAGVTDLGTVGLTGRGGYGRHLGYGIGFDLEGGVGFPLGFAYAARLYPAGLVLMLGDNTFVGAFTGIGTNGVASRVAPGLELPTELRVEIDVAPRARVGARAGVGWYPASHARRGRSVVSPLADELVLSAFVRLGEADQCGCGAHIGRGYFFALERGELLGSPWVGAGFGIEADFGG